MRVFVSDMPFHGESISENMSRTPDGFLIAHNVRIARTGTQFYAGRELGLHDRTNDRVTAYRLEEDVFNEISLKSFEGKPVTDDHPPGDMVTPTNYRQYTRGHIQNVRRDGIWVMADIVIKDADLIAKVENGKREVSAGYWCDYDEYKDGFRQCNIIANHLSVVDKARAGDKARMRDSEQIIDGEISMTYTAEQVAALLNAQTTKDAAPAATESHASNDTLVAKMFDYLFKSKPAKDEESEEDKDKEKKETSDALRAEVAELKKTVDALVNAKTSDEDDDEDEDKEKKEAKDAVAEILATLDEDDDEDEDDEDKKAAKDAQYKAARDALKPALVGMSPAKQQKAKDALRVKFGKKPTSDSYLQIQRASHDTSATDAGSDKAIQDSIKAFSAKALGEK